MPTTMNSTLKLLLKYDKPLKFKKPKDKDKAYTEGQRKCKGDKEYLANLNAKRKFMTPEELSAENETSAGVMIFQGICLIACFYILDYIGIF